MKARALDIFKFIIGWPLSILALFFIIRLIIPQISQVQSAITSVNILLLMISVFCFIAYYISRTYLWHEIIKRKGIEISLRETMHLWSLSEINRYIPGNIWSFLSRSVRFGEKKLSKKDIATSLFHETLFVMMAALIVSLLSIPYLLKIPFAKDLIDTIGSDYVILGVGLVTLLFVFQRVVIGRFSHKLSEKPVFIQETSRMNMRFLGISILGMLAFGFGYFFAIVSVVSLPAQDFFTISGFAVVSLLIGYLSFVTPTGLGIREGFLTLGLAPFMGISLAGFAALFARVTLIISELVFLFGASLLYKTKNSRVLNMEHYIKSHITEAFLTLAVLAYSVYFTAASFLRYDNFNTGRFDLGNMVQTVWNSSQGRLFLFTNPDNTETISRLAYHADFILLLFVPFYSIWNHPYLLLFTQTVVVASGAFFLYGIARHLLKEKVLSLIIAFAYLLNPALERSNLYDFHAVVLATTFFLAAWYFFLKRKYIWLIVFLVLAGITKEQVWAITALFGLLIIGREYWLHRKSKFHPLFILLSQKFLFGLSVFVISILLFYLFIWQLIPGARGGEHFAIEFYGEFGSSPTDIIATLLSSPDQALRVLVGQDRIEYLNQLLLPLGYIPILFPFILFFAFPDILINLLSGNSNLHQIYYQYTATITPFLFIAAVYAIYWIHRFFPKIALSVFSVYILVVSLYGSYLYGPLPGNRRPNLAMFDNKTPNRMEIAEFLEQIPRSMSVSATNNAGSHLSEREQIYTIPVGMDEADYLVFLVDAHPNRDLEMKKHVVWYMNNPNYLLVKRLDNFYVFRKNRYLTTYF